MDKTKILWNCNCTKSKQIIGGVGFFGGFILAIFVTSLCVKIFCSLPFLVSVPPFWKSVGATAQLSLLSLTSLHITLQTWTLLQPNWTRLHQNWHYMAGNNLHIAWPETSPSKSRCKVAKLYHWKLHCRQVLDTAWHEPASLDNAWQPNDWILPNRELARNCSPED